MRVQYIKNNFYKVQYFIFQACGTRIRLATVEKFWTDFGQSFQKILNVDFLKPYRKSKCPHRTILSWLVLFLVSMNQTILCGVAMPLSLNNTKRPFYYCIVFWGRVQVLDQLKINLKCKRKRKRYSTAVFS